MPYISTPEQLGLERGLLKGIEAVLELRFGAAGLQLLPQLKELDYEKLDAVLLAAKNAADLDEFRGLIPPAP
jgi:hypothetical protein